MHGLVPEFALAAGRLRFGGVVAYPTENAYCLGADAMNPKAVKRLLKGKGRQTDRPPVIHLATAEWLEEWAGDIPPAARILAEACWPGGLILVLPRQSWVPDILTDAQDCVALRVPEHPVALQLIAASGALATISDGDFSSSATVLMREDLAKEADLILEGDPCRPGLESTVVRFLDGKMSLLKQGHVSVAEMEEVLELSLGEAFRFDSEIGT